MFIIYHIFHSWSIHYRRKMDEKYFFENGVRTKDEKNSEKQ